MNIENHSQFESVTIASRVAGVVGDELLENGVSLASVLVTALETDRRISRRNDAAAVHLALSDDEIFDLGGEMKFCFERDHGFQLPLGTTVTPSTRGSLKLGSESWVLDVARPGLHAVETVRHDAHGPNLRALRDHVTRLTRGLPWHRIGVPSAAFVVDTDARHLLQFPPFLEAGGVVMQRDTLDTGAARFCSATPVEIETFARSIVDDMRALWVRREEIAAIALNVRARAQAKIDAVDVEGFAIRAVCIDMERQREEPNPALYVEYDAIDEAMRPGVVLDYMRAEDPLEPYRLVTPNGVSGRHEDRAALHAKGAEGTIDGVALAVLRAGPEDERTVLARLASSYEAFVTFMTPAGPLYATLFWRGGCIRAEVTVPGQLDWYNDLLELFDRKLDEADVAKLVGVSVDDVPGLPFSCAGKVVGARFLYRGVKLSIEVDEHLVSCSRGEVWSA